MDADTKQPPIEPETEFTGDLQVFSGFALSPDDPSLEPRERKGRPADRQFRMDDGRRPNKP
jgi:hypothetical protein